LLPDVSELILILTVVWWLRKLERDCQ